MHFTHGRNNLQSRILSKSSSSFRIVLVPLRGAPGGPGNPWGGVVFCHSSPCEPILPRLQCPPRPSQTPQVQGCGDAEYLASRCCGSGNCIRPQWKLPPVWKCPRGRGQCTRQSRPLSILQSLCLQFLSLLRQPWDREEEDEEGPEEECR